MSETAVSDEFLSGLTDLQRAAVLHIDGPLLVLAGPGSGKTRVITHRIAYLLNQGIPAWSILALTFTNKAAGEMRQRIEKMLAGTTHNPARLTISTFHTFCARMLRRYAQHAGVSPRFTIYDAADQRDAIKQALAESSLSADNWAPAAIASAISGAKNKLEGAEEYAASAHDFRAKTYAKVYRTYERILKTAEALDFDDLLLRMARLLKDSEPVRRELQQRFQYILIDEYQDTNQAQFMIAHTLASAPGSGNICVVGDPDQSIYAWRGADLRNILQFEQHYPQAKIIPLGQNFRSTGHIVSAADALIRNNRRRKHKTLHTELGDGEKVTVLQCRDEHHEARLVAAELERGHQSGIAWKDMAVAYRVNALSRVMEERLRDEQIPYVIARGTAFYDRKEIKDALAYLRVAANPADDVALRRIVNTPARGISKVTLDRIEIFAINQQMRLFEAMDAVERIGDMTTKAIGSVRKFVQMVNGWRTTGVGTTLADLVARVVKESGLEAMYNQSKTDEDAQRVENLGELVSAATEFSPPAPDAEDDDGGAAAASPGALDALRSFLESVALVSDADVIDPANGAVTLLTLHAAKGLEFEIVAMIGLEEGLLPHSRAREGEADLEEERRLCFVGMTRAKRVLLMSRAAYRTIRGLRELTMESQFLRELPEKAVERRDESDSDFEEAFADEQDQDWGHTDGNEPPAIESFPVGCLVRHPRFGLGRVESVGREGRGTRARVAFTTGGTKTLILEYANLQRVK